jgi:mannosyltransferase
VTAQGLLKPRRRAASAPPWWPVLPIVALAAALRLAGLPNQPLWMDEIASLRNAQVLARSGLPAVAAGDHIAPLSAVLDSVSIGIGGPSEFWLRLPAAVAGTLAVAMTYAVAQRILHDRAIAVGAALFTAVAPFAVWYGQEARMYSLLLLFSLVYVWACWRLVDGTVTRRDWILMTAAAAVGLWTHHYMALLIVAFGLFLLVRTGLRAVFRLDLGARPLFLWAGTQLIAAGTFVPWLVLTRGLGKSAGFEKSGQLMWLPYTLFSDLAGSTLGPSVRDLRDMEATHALFQRAPAVALTLVAFTAVAVTGLRVLWKRSKPATAWIICWGLVPPVLAIALTFVADVSYNTRYAITAFPAMGLLVGAAISRVSKSWSARLAAVLTAVVVVWSLANWYVNPHYGKDDLRSPAAVLAHELRPGDVLVLDNARAASSLDYYGWRCAASDVVVRSAEGAKAVAAALSSRAMSGTTWLLVFRPWETDPAGLVPAALDAGHGGQLAGSWPGSTLTRYPGTAVVSARPGVDIGCPL